jgi:hypothetical protein
MGFAPSTRVAAPIVTESMASFWALQAGVDVRLLLPIALNALGAELVHVRRSHPRVQDHHNSAAQPLLQRVVVQLQPRGVVRDQASIAARIKASTTTAYRWHMLEARRNSQNGWPAVMAHGFEPC